MLVPTRELAVQVRDEVDKLAHGRRIALRAGLRRQADPRADRQAAKRGRRRHRHARPRARPHRPRHARSAISSRSSCSTKPTGCSTSASGPTSKKSSAAARKERQTLLLSATVAPPVERLARTYMRDPEVMDFSPKNMSVETIEQYYFTVDHERKFDLLVQLLKREKPRAGDRLLPHQARHRQDPPPARARSSQSVDMIHGDMQQTARDRVMKAFRAGEVRILVATDVVGRGIDVTSISHIINYDIPQSSRRLRPPRRPHRPHGPRRRRLHVRHPRRRRRADADRDADQPAARSATRSKASPPWRRR